jgi:hypothetical protein
MSNYMTEFPDYDDTLILPEGWQDMSWHNDACPSFDRKFGNINFRIYCEYKDPNKRESLGELRFIVYYEDEVNFVCIGQTRTLAAALAIIDKELEL